MIKLYRLILIFFILLVINCTRKNNIDFSTLKKDEINKIQMNGDSIFINCIFNDYKLNKNDWYNTIELLLKNGADTNIIFSDTSHTAINAAITMNDINIIKLLIKYNVNVNQLQNYRASPLQLCLRKDRIKLAFILIDNGADVNYINKDMDDSDSILMKSISLNNEKLVKLVKLVIDKGADIKYKNNEGLTAMDYASKLANKKIVSLLK